MSSRSRKYNAVSLFSGAGGLDLGFELTNRINVLQTHEANETFVNTLKLNKGKKINKQGILALEKTSIFQSDLSKIAELTALNEMSNEVDVVYGGPPCQSFSVAGNRLGIADLRGSLIYSFVEVIEILKPKGFLFENVPGFKTIHNGELHAELIQKFHKLGYSTWAGVVNAADYGAATFRERFFIIGVSGGLSLHSPLPTHIDPTHISSFHDDMFGENLKPWVTCGEVLKQFRQINNLDEIKNHLFVNHKPETIERFSRLQHGERDEIRRRNRLDPARPSYTIFVGGELGKLQARTHIHPYEDRELTPRECAVIHGFPDSWEFEGNLDFALLQVANSVPVPLGNQMAKHLIDFLDKSAN